ncbi:hypothetical protein LWI29_030001 [Acer saccharum]|uniref:Uncharacterized protein n=1 Tax=Acer saccharum TaxID=4024 RepID=A0AA39VXH6_ACESA|nr:hypothetical protein LWI29_030001 [Acer saccharum]
MEEGVVLGREDDGSDLAGQVSQVGGFSDGTLSFEGFSSATSSSSSIREGGESEDTEKLIDRSINATIVLAAGTFAINKLLTIDQHYWQAGWKLWPFAHLVTYGLIPLEQRLLWVDCVELIWVTILSM